MRAKGFAMLVSVVLSLLLGAIANKTTPQNLTIQATQAFNEFVNPLALNAIGWKYVGVDPWTGLHSY